MKHKLGIVALIISAVFVVTEVFSRVSFRSGEPPDISGIYLFKKENCSKDGCFFGADKQFTIGYLSNLPGDVRIYVVQTPSGITISHPGWQNKPMKMELLRNDPGLGWNKKELVYK